MKLPQRNYTMENSQPTPNQTPQVTLISDSVSIPPFSGIGSETIHAFIRRVDEECTRRNAHTNAEKLAILKSRICHEPTSLAGKLVKCDKFLSFTTYADFSAALVSHFSGHSKLGATHSFLKIAQTLTSMARSTHDVYRAENVASSLSAELTEQLIASQCFDDHGKISSNEFKRLMSYLLFLVQLDSPTFKLASDIKFNHRQFLYDLCKQISEKSPPTPQPVSVVQSPPILPVQPPPGSHSHVPPPRSPSPISRSRPSSRSYHRSQSRHHSSSRNSRPTSCYRCGIKGHSASQCRVVLDDQGRHQFNPDAFCSLHNKHGHSLAECRLYQYQLSSHSQPSGNAARLNRNPPR